ncbi:MAG: hypothetical protein WCP91_04105 [Candidatus Berkelbacteria bacterium]
MGELVNTLSIDRVPNAVNTAFADVLKAPSAQKLLESCDTGGYFCLKVIGREELLIEPMLIGEVSDDNKDEYIELCQEKVHRLEAEFLADPQHVRSSYQSRDPENNKWGGAITGFDNDGTGYLFGFSGLPELCDEAIMVVAVMEVGLLADDEALEIAEISGSDDILWECVDFGDGIVDDGSDR